MIFSFFTFSRVNLRLNQINPDSQKGTLFLSNVLTVLFLFGKYFFMVFVLTLYCQIHSRSLCQHPFNLLKKKRTREKISVEMMILNNLLGRKLLFHAQIKHQNLKHSRIKMTFRFSFFLSFSFMTCSYFPETFSFLLSSSWQNFVLHFFFNFSITEGAQ